MEHRYNRWIAYHKSQSKVRLRLFCFPYAGGGASIFRNWSDMVPPEIEVCPVQLPGRESRIADPVFTHLPSLIEEVSQAIYPYLTIPFVFFGHSMGAIISFELARYLRRQNDLTPNHLFVSAHRAPQRSYKEPLSHTLPDTELIERLRLLNGTEQDILANSELMELLLPILRADLELCETHRYFDEGALSCPISVMGGLQDEEVSYDDLLAWKEHTCSSFTLRMFEGNHFFLHAAQRVLLSLIVQDLTEYLL